MEYNYSKLRGRIVEKCGSNEAFAKKIGMSKTSVSLKLNNKTAWSQDDISRTCSALDIPLERAGEFFFVRKLGTSTLPDQ